MLIVRAIRKARKALNHLDGILWAMEASVISIQHSSMMTEREDLDSERFKEAQRAGELRREQCNPEK